MPNDSRKLKVLLLQLPFLYILLQSRKQTNTNVPIAAGYLKAAASRRGLLDRVDIEIFDTSRIDKYGDQLLLDEVLAAGPDVVGFSIYEWNAEQSFQLMHRLREVRPDILIVCGGPELVPRSHHFARESAIDVAVFGDGEDIFCAVLEELLRDRRDWSSVPGICWRDGDRIVDNPRPAAQVDFAGMPSPYLLGYIDTSLSRSMIIETERGCSFKCSYCNWSGTAKNVFAPERIRREIAFAVDHDLDVISVVDPTFNLSKLFRETCGFMKELDPDRRIGKFANILAEALKPEDARLLAEAGFRYVTVGLQSTNPVALRAVRRMSHLRRLSEGVRMLLDAGVTPYVDIILGLPGETLESTKETVRWIREQGLAHLSRYNILTVNPDTTLWARREELGLVTQPDPPYRILRTPTLSYAGIREAIRYCDEELQFGQCYGHYEEPSLAEHWRTPRIGDAAGEDPDGIPSPPREKAVTKVLLDLGALDPERAAPAGRTVAPLLGSHPYIWFRADDLAARSGGARAFLASASAPNPYLIWKLVLESDVLFHANLAAEIEAAIAYRVNNVDYDCVYRGDPPEDRPFVRTAVKAFAILPPEAVVGSPDGTDALIRSGIPVFTRLRFTRDLPAEDLIDLAFAKATNGLFLDFEDDRDPDFVFDAMRALVRRMGGYGRNILFRNGLLQQAFDWRLRVQPFMKDEHVVRIGASGDAETRHWNRDDARVRIGRWIDLMLKRDGAQRIAPSSPA